MKLLGVLSTVMLWAGGKPGWSVLAAVLTVLVYAGQCVFFPWGRCAICKGSGRWESSSGKNWRDCWWCGGMGRRLRLVRRIYNRMYAVRKKAGA